MNRSKTYWIQSNLDRRRRSAGNWFSTTDLPTDTESERTGKSQASLLGDDESIGEGSTSSTCGVSTSSRQGAESCELLREEGASLLNLELLLLELELLFQTRNFEGVATEAVQDLDLSAELVGELHGAIDINELREEKMGLG